MGLHIPESYSAAFTVDVKHDYLKEYRDGSGLFTYRRMVSWDDCPHLQTGNKQIERNNLIKKYGLNSAFVRSMIFGQFQRAADYNPIYTENDLALMRKAMLRDFRPVGNDIQAAGDISGGGDEQILLVRIGTEIVLQDYRQCADELDQADYWVTLLKELGIPPHRFAVDGGGLGATVANYMERRLGYSGIQRCQANTGPTYKFEFRDKYTEVHFFLKELLSANVLKFKQYDDVLLKQMRARRWIEMEAGEKIKTEPKPAHRRREKSSPDRLDTLVYLFYNFNPYLIPSRIGAVYEQKEEHFISNIEREAEKNSLNFKGAFSKVPSASEIRDRMNSDRRRISMRIGAH